MTPPVVALLEYEIPPFRAIYHQIMHGEGETLETMETAVRDFCASQMPAWHPRRIVINPQPSDCPVGIDLPPEPA